MPRSPTWPSQPSIRSVGSPILQSLLITQQAIPENKSRKIVLIHLGPYCSLLTWKGTITESHPNAMFRTYLDNGFPHLDSHIGEISNVNCIRILPRDRGEGRSPILLDG